MRKPNISSGADEQIVKLVSTYIIDFLRVNDCLQLINGPETKSSLNKY